MVDENILRSLYLDYLEEEITFNGRNKRSRVRHPKQYHNVNLAPTYITEADMNNVWVWSDTHFFHRNIIKYSNRPFEDIDEMNERMVSNFNQLVQPNDVSIWVGDVAFSNVLKANNVINRCNGYKILVVGNHDFQKKRVLNLDFDEIHLTYTILDEIAPLFFSHYPLPSIPRPWVNIHGHIHNQHIDHPFLINVSVEVLDYSPIHINELKRKARTRVISYDE